MGVVDRMGLQPQQPPRGETRPIYIVWEIIINPLTATRLITSERTVCAFEIVTCD